MIKKLLSVTSLVAGMMLSGHALAAGTALPAGGIMTPADCPALDNNVTVQLSKNVFAGFSCSTTALMAGTCHSNGTNKTTTQTCAWVKDPADATGATFLPNFTACGTTPNATGTAAPTVTATGRVGFRGGSGGGTVGVTELGSVNCDQAAVIADVFMPTVQ